MKVSVGEVIVLILIQGFRRLDFLNNDIIKEIILL